MEIQKIYLPQKVPLGPFLICPFANLQMLAITDLISVPIVFPFLKYYINRIICYVAISSLAPFILCSFEIHRCYFMY